MENTRSQEGLWYHSTRQSQEGLWYHSTRQSQEGLWYHSTRRSQEGLWYHSTRRSQEGLWYHSTRQSQEGLWYHSTRRSQEGLWYHSTSRPHFQLSNLLQSYERTTDRNHTRLPSHLEFTDEGMRTCFICTINNVVIQKSMFRKKEEKLTLLMA